jgi:hypothetical protein
MLPVPLSLSLSLSVHVHVYAKRGNIQTLSSPSVIRRVTTTVYWIHAREDTCLFSKHSHYGIWATMVTNQAAGDTHTRQHITAPLVCPQRRPRQLPLRVRCRTSIAVYSRRVWCQRSNSADPHQGKRASLWKLEYVQYSLTYTVPRKVAFWLTRATAVLCNDSAVDNSSSYWQQCNLTIRYSKSSHVITNRYIHIQ